MELHRFLNKVSASLDTLFPGWRLETVAAITAMAGVLLSVFAGFHPHIWQSSGSDFKTLYASAWCFARGIDAYTFTGLGNVFTANHVVLPKSWYAHAPVYPPFTLALISIVTLLPMVPAIYAWIVLSTLVTAFAAAALARAAGEALGLGRPWRMLMIALFAASPLLSFGIEMGNVSVMVSALCILVVAPTVRANLSLRAAGLALALLLKPHIAIWVVIALLLLPEPRGRSIARRSIAICAGLLVCIALAMAFTHQFTPQIDSYRAMLNAEIAGGSMDPMNREVIAVAAQITSLATLLGFWLSPAVLPQIQIPLLLLLSALLCWISLSRPAHRPEERLALIGAWCAFGMLASYHRAHDGIILLLLLPWLLARLRRSMRDTVAWATFALMAAVSIGPDSTTLQQLSTMPNLHTLAEFILYRQAPFAEMLLMLVLLGCALKEELSRKREARRVAPVLGLRA